jgi:hypothetical protein
MFPIHLEFFEIIVNFSENSLKYTHTHNYEVSPLSPVDLK